MSDYNARRINAITRSHRNNPSAAGADDGERVGFEFGYDFERAKCESRNPSARLDYKRNSDPRWHDNREYRRAFGLAAKRAFAEGRATFRSSYE